MIAWFALGVITTFAALVGVTAIYYGYEDRKLSDLFFGVFVLLFWVLFLGVVVSRALA